MAIDIGAAAIDRLNSLEAAWTFITRHNAANATGTLDTIEVWASVNMSNLEVATFFVVSGLNYSTRGNVTIGSVTAGSKQTFTGLSISVATGDYLGWFFSAGGIEQTTSGGDFSYIFSFTDQIPCTNVAFLDSGNKHQFSLYGTGTEAAVGWANIAKVMGVAAADIAKMNSVLVADIAKIGGVAV